MLTYAVIFALFAGILAIMLSRPSCVIYLKRLAIPAVCIIFVLCLLLFSKTAVTSASRGLRLWFDIVFPSLFPFFVASEILNSTGFAEAAGVMLEPAMRPLFNVPGCGSLALLMGVAGGYPAGAKITCDLHEKGLVSKAEAERLLAFTNNSSPLFITGAVATGMYSSPRLGFLFLACHILACLTVGFLFRFHRRNGTMHINTRINRISNVFPKELKKPVGRERPNSATIFGDAVRNSVTLILAIGGFIILFSVIIGILLETGVINGIAAVLAELLSPFGIDSGTIAAVLSGFFEITAGSSMASSLTGIPLEQQLPAASFIIGWAGLSVHSQVLGIAGRTGISIRPYLAGKFLQGLIAAFYTWAGLKLSGADIWLSKPAMSQFASHNPGWPETAVASLMQLVVVFTTLAVMIAGSLLSIYIKKKKLRS